MTPPLQGHVTEWVQYNCKKQGGQIDPPPGPYRDSSMTVLEGLKLQITQKFAYTIYHKTPLKFLFLPFFYIVEALIP